MTALKWPRPGGFHIRDAILARRHSRFSHVFDEISDGKLSILRFFAKKCDGAKLASSRGWRFRDAILARRHSRFSHFFGNISDGKLSILRFFAKKCDGAKLAPSRGWRFWDAILTRRHEQQIPPCPGSFLIFDEKMLLLQPPKMLLVYK